MSGNIALYLRLPSASLVVCVMVFLFAFCSDAARASPTTTQAENGVKHNILRSLFTPSSRHHPLYAGLLSTETGLRPRSESNTEITRNSRGALTITDHQLNPLRFTKGGFGYNENSPDPRQSHVGMTRGQSGHSPGGVRPTNSIFISHSQHWGQSFGWPQSRSNYHPLSQEVAQTGNSYNSHPLIIRKSFQKEAGIPLHQSSSFSQVWDRKDAQKSHNEGNIPRNDSPKLAADKTSWPLQRGEHRRASLPSPRGHYSGYKETNELPAVRAQSTFSGIQSNKFPSFASQAASQAPSVSDRLEVSVIKRNPGPEKVTTSITDFSPRAPNTGTSSETLRHKNVRSYLFKGSQATFETVNTVTGGGQEASRGLRSFTTMPYMQRPSDAQVYTLFAPDFKKLNTKAPIKEDNADPLYLNTNVAKGGGRTGGFPKYPPTFSMYPPAKHSQQYNSDKGKDYKFNTANIYSSLSSKYSFGQRGGPTVTNTPAKLERTPIDFLPFSPGSSDLIRTTTVSIPRLFTSAFNDVRPLLPESDDRTDGKPDHRRSRTDERIYGLRGFGTQPLEGAKSLVRAQDRSGALPQGFEGFELRGSQVWQPKSSGIHRWYNQTGETEPETGNISTQRRNELSSEDLKPPLKPAGSAEPVQHSRFMPDKYRRNRKIYTFLGFQSIPNKIENAHEKTWWKYAEQSPTIASPTPTVSSARLRLAGGPKVDSGPASEPRTSNKNKPVAMKASLLHSSTSSTVRGKRVRGKHINGKKLNESAPLTSDAGSVAIVRPPKRPAGVKAVTYADVLGSASFISVRATTKAPDKGYFPNTMPTTKQKAGVGHRTLSYNDGLHRSENTSRSPEAKAEDEAEDFSSIKEQKLSFKSRGFDSGKKTFGAFLDNEGSGSVGFDPSDVLQTDSEKTQGLGEDLLELDYLRKSTGNISFKSVKLSHAEK